jgi:hypothetical protein
MVIDQNNHFSQRRLPIFAIAVLKANFSLKKSLNAGSTWAVLQVDLRG